MMIEMEDGRLSPKKKVKSEEEKKKSEEEKENTKKIYDDYLSQF